MDPVGYIRRNWGDAYKSWSDEVLQVEAYTMLLLRSECSRMAVDDLSSYTRMMATILEVKRNLMGCDGPVLDRNDWNQSLLSNPSKIQLQKWIFAWMYARTNLKKKVVSLRAPEVSFEADFMKKHKLKYNGDAIIKMKKNTKTCVQLLYNVRARSWKDRMTNFIKDKLNIIITLTAPREVRCMKKRYRRDPNTFYIGEIVDGKTIWTEVSAMYFGELCGGILQTKIIV